MQETKEQDHIEFCHEEMRNSFHEENDQSFLKMLGNLENGSNDGKTEQEKLRNVLESVENKRAPHLVNLNEDPQLSQRVYYALKECK